MRILIVGYGSMGREVEKILLERHHEIAGRVDPSGSGDFKIISPEVLEKCDGVIEFALADGVLRNIQAYAEAGVPAVIGTTGWEDQRGAAEKIIQAKQGALLWGNNFSIGANIFFALVSKAAALVNSIDEYDVMLNEYHHKRKKDSPSGTALTAAEKILANLDRKSVIQTETLHKAIEEHELHVGSVRGGAIPGIHSMTLDSEADTLEISHTARTRGGFALGSVRGIEWLSGRKGFFSVDDFMSEILPA